MAGTIPLPGQTKTFGLESLPCEQKETGEGENE